VPREARRAYDVRDAIRRVVDGGRLLEVSERWARNMVTAFARIDGRAVGVLANQPRYLGGTIDSDAAQKAARFVRTCNSFGLPLVVLVDTPGFMPGTRQEASGVIRHGAKLLHAFAEATVPRFQVVLRKAFGGAYITMNSRDLGADLSFAWPQAEIGVMAASQAVGLIRRREIAAADDPALARATLADDYAREHLGAHMAAREGFIDEVIEPAETRDRLAWALTAFARERRRPASGNIPL
jgi:acetyl-CoA carboxylase carboxyltransferase component